jgi:hypothetical protein
MSDQADQLADGTKTPEKSKEAAGVRIAKT